MKRIASTLFSLFLASVVTAQVYTPPSPPNGPAGGKAAPANPSAATSAAPAAQSQAPASSTNAAPNKNSQFLGNTIPFLDPTTEVFSFDGKSFSITDNRIFRSRFEKYLNAAPATSEQEVAYNGVMRNILDTLSPHHQEKNKFALAVAQLEIAAKFPQDGRLCESLANTIYRVYLAQGQEGKMKAALTELEKERRQLDWNYDSWKRMNETSNRERKMTDDPKAKKATPSITETAGHLTRYVQRISEVEAERVSNKASSALIKVQSKVEFQSLIIQFFLQRRFEHVVIASRLYTEMFQDGGTLDLKDGAAVKDSFTKLLGYNPTVSTFDTLATSMIRETDQAVESFTFLLGSGRIDGAMSQLQQAFVIGEYLSSVQTVPRESRMAILEYTKDAFQLLSALEVKDYGLAEQLVNRMKEKASDFDYSKPTAAIEAARLSSNMRIRAAKNAALKGNEEEYEKNIKEAAEIWPQNPMLKEQFELIADSADLKQQAKIEFDRLLGTQSYRQIFNNRARFIAASVDDPDRQEKLEQIIGNIQEIETVMKQADTLKKAGNEYAAWEIVERSFQKFPDDVPLSTKRSDLATGVASFVRALKNGENLETRKQFGSSLAWYLSARRMFPQSEFAQEGIARLVDHILPESEPVKSASTSESKASDVTP